jgi:hypothetical protein
MADSIFYSWQSDLPNATNRGFIERALQAAAEAIRDDDSLTVSPVVDRDTLGVPGAPDIATTIFAKIDKAAVFVCDVSIINAGQPSRPTPNPNVLIELGYAKKSLGADRVLMVMNTAYGGPELLPFDLRLRRIVTYEMAEAREERAPERKRLAGVLELGLRASLDQVTATVGEVIEPLPVLEQLRASITARGVDQAPLARRYMSDLLERMRLLNPDLSVVEGDAFDEPVVKALQDSLPLIREFEEVAATIATQAAREAALGIHEGFGQLVDRYDAAPGFSGSFRTVDFDFSKFIGHELFVALVAPMLKERRWDLIRELVETDIYVTNRRNAPPSLLPYDVISQYVEILSYRSRRLKLNRVSLHADLLQERHAGALDEFVDADYLLFLRSIVQREDADAGREWRASSCLYLGPRVPRFLAEAERRRSADTLAEVLGAPSIDELRARLKARMRSLRELFPTSPFYRPLEGFDAGVVGSR